MKTVSGNRSQENLRLWIAFFRENDLDVELKRVLSKLKNHDSRFVPSQDQIMEAFRWTSPKESKVVIFGSEPYRGSHATGLSFQIPKNHRPTGTIKNIQKELYLEYGKGPASGSINFDSWARQHVLLLNTAFTAPASAREDSHHRIWRRFSSKLVEILSRKYTGKVYLLWGQTAKSLKEFVAAENNFVFTCGHPGARFVNREISDWLGNNHFGKTNQCLVMVDSDPIKWLL